MTVSLLGLLLWQMSVISEAVADAVHASELNGRSCCQTGCLLSNIVRGKYDWAHRWSSVSQVPLPESRTTCAVLVLQETLLFVSLVPCSVHKYCIHVCTQSAKGEIVHSRYKCTYSLFISNTCREPCFICCPRVNIVRLSL